jgi:hypothetical protein
MKYINKYADLAAYNADTNRPTEDKTISKVAGALRYEGKNVIVDKKYCDIGDTIVFDKNDSTIKAVKLDTLNRATLPSNFVIGGVVYYRTEEMAYIVSINPAINSMWAAPYKVKVIGFDFTTGGNFTITVNTTTTGTITYTTSDTLTTVATSMMSALEAVGFKAETGWSCTAYTDYNCIVVQQNWYTPNVTKFVITDESTKVTRTILTGNYQTALSGILTPFNFIHRNDGVNTSFAGCNLEKFILYYSIYGEDLTDQIVGASSIIKESKFTNEYNPLLVATYGTYRNYMKAKMMQYPYSKGAIIDDSGKANTIALSAVTYTDYDGTQKPAYPAAYNAYTYGLITEGYTTGFEAGNWYLENVRLTNILMKDITYGLSGITGINADPVNRSIYAAGGSMISVSAYPWTSTESSSTNAWFYNGGSGIMSARTKGNVGILRPASAFQLR